MKKFGSFLLCVLMLSLVLGLFGCAQKAELNDDNGVTPDTSVTGTENENGTNSGAQNGSTNTGSTETQEPLDDTIAKTLLGEYTSENGDTYAFNGDTFSFVPKQGHCLRGTYAFKVAENGKLRILLTVKYSGPNESALTEIEPLLISSGDGADGVPYYEGDGYIKIDLTKYVAE